MIKKKKFHYQLFIGKSVAPKIYFFHFTREVYFYFIRKRKCDMINLAREGAEDSVVQGVHMDRLKRASYLQRQRLIERILA